MSSLRILLAASEAAPFAKTGGLADVVTGLGRELARRGHTVRIVMPLYPRVLDAGVPIEAKPFLENVHVTLGGKSQRFDVVRGELPGAPEDRAEVWFIESPAAFAREQLYSSDHPDEHLRTAMRRLTSVCSESSLAG